MLSSVLPFHRWENRGSEGMGGWEEQQSDVKSRILEVGLAPDSSSGLISY